MFPEGGKRSRVILFFKTVVSMQQNNDKIINIRWVEGLIWAGIYVRCAVVV